MSADQRRRAGRRHRRGHGLARARRRRGRAGPARARARAVPSRSCAGRRCPSCTTPASSSTRPPPRWCGWATSWTRPRRSRRRWTRRRACAYRAFSNPVVKVLAYSTGRGQRPATFLRAPPRPRTPGGSVVANGRAPRPDLRRPERPRRRRATPPGLPDVAGAATRGRRG